MQKRTDGTTITVPVPLHNPVRAGTLSSIIRQSAYRDPFSSSPPTALYDIVAERNTEREEQPQQEVAGLSGRRLLAHVDSLSGPPMLPRGSPRWRTRPNVSQK
jgi:hypothetical protein